MTSSAGSPASAAARPSDLVVVRGGRPLRGSVAVSGFKHSLVSAVAAAAAAGARLRLRNCPAIEETAVLAALLRRLGAEADVTDATLTIDGSGIGTGGAPPSIPSDVVSRIHGSVYLLPALLGRFGAVEVMEAGGCRIGDDRAGRRPTGHYVEVFERFGARSRTAPDGAVQVVAPRLRATTIDMADFMSDRTLRTGPLYSGATKTALLTAAMAHGTSVVRSPYPKPDVTELVAVLGALGVAVERTGDGDYVVEGCGGPLPGPAAEHALIPDLIAVVTWICAAAVAADAPVAIMAPRLSDAAVALAPELDVLADLGVHTEWDAEACVVHPVESVRPVEVLAASHGVFSDSQPLLALVAALAPGTSHVRDTVWSGRFGYAAGFAALGMDVAVDGPSMRVTGPWRPRVSAGPVRAHDLRAAAALLLAALAVPGVTTLHGTGHLARGYPDLPGDLNGLGACIERRGM